MKAILQVLFATLLALRSAFAADPAYPQNPIRLIIPYVVGGGTDTVGRLLAEPMAKILGTRIVVDNRPGGTGSIGAMAVKTAPPDGYTIMLHGSGFVQFPLLSGNAPYDIKEFAPIAHAVDAPFFFIVNQNTPARSIPELIDYAKKNPGKLNYGSTGIGSPGHLTGELFQSLTGTKLTHIPYKGGAQVQLAMLSNEVQLYWDSVSAYAPYQASGQLKPLAVGRHDRFSAAPEVVGMSEAGVPELKDFEAGFWLGFLAPAGTPPAVIDKLNAAVSQTLALPAVRDRLATLGFEPVGGSAQAFTRRLSADQTRWASIIKEARITAE
ncbi:MAG: Bug family tripartite tricarboxylate transporter substrate binding protein [Hyphomicrobiaceae bacterium]